MFVKIDVNNAIEQFPYSFDMFREDNKNVSLPKFLNNNFLESRNVYPVYLGDKQVYDDVAYSLILNDTPDYVVDKWVLSWHTVAKDTSTIAYEFTKNKSDMLDNINQLRLAQIYKTFTVTLSNGSAVPVDIRAGKPDLENLSNLVLGATIKKLAGDTSIVKFRGANNVEYNLLPDDVIKLGTVVSAMVSDVYEQSWAIKAAVEAAADSYELKTVNTTFVDYIQI